MKKAGIVGGIGPASTLDYYSGIINGVRELTKSGEYPKIVIDSINMTEMLGYVAANDRAKLIDILVDAIDHLAAAGADFAAIASNTPHIVFEDVRARARLPLLSIVEETCRCAAKRGVKKAVVLGTLFTMKSGLYTNALEKHGIAAVVPDDGAQNDVYNIIFPNLEEGIVLPEEKQKLLHISEDLLAASGADALVLGCTELPLAFRPGDLNTILLDTAQIHIAAIVREMLS
ncbi:aspartate racemase [Sporobacter termitidis DSM 10068]|uniref:Aspartate racemase n=1 Tax=Sporobacter termitidis DSM 10068 TaxID=1123282 RepID=A0A1M5W9U6_9FIRM|nr:amino acid racemase [Sporobacter termitidis]SHH83964.1 aspartate racemase [Sporobacter termitidis DSM 10068]